MGVVLTAVLGRSGKWHRSLLALRVSECVRTRVRVCVRAVPADMLVVGAVQSQSRQCCAAEL